MDRLAILIRLKHPKLATKTASAIAASAEAIQNVKQLQVHHNAPPTVVDTILGHMPALEDVDVSIKATSASTPWSPAITSKRVCKMKLQSFNPFAMMFSTHVPMNPEDQAAFDMHGIARNQQLQQLTLEGGGLDLTSWGSVSLLTHLNELNINGRYSHPWRMWHPSCTQDLTPLQELPLLHQLHTDWHLDPEHWAIVAGMKQLRSFKASYIEVEKDSPSSSITSFEVITGFEVTTGMPAVDIAGREPGSTGLLETLLPELEICVLGSAEYAFTADQDLLSLVRGHSKVRSLRLNGRTNPEATYMVFSHASWPAGILSSLASLEEVEICDVRQVDVDAMLTEAAGCSKLRTLKLLYIKGRVGVATFGAEGAGLVALANGSCGETLESVTISIPGQAVPLVCAAPLLKLRSLRKLACCFTLAGDAKEPRSAERVLQQLPGALAALGVQAGRALEPVVLAESSSLEVDEARVLANGKLLRCLMQYE